MKKALSTKYIFILLTIIITGLTSCKKEMFGAENSMQTNTSGGTVGTPPGKIFSVSRFKSNLQSQISFSSVNTQPRGYTFVINKDGKWADTASFGIARNTNGSTAKQHVNQEINIASVTKSMTAVAVLQLLKKTNRNLGSTIGEWLPASWSPSNAIKSLTFQDLLTHSSGLTQTNTDWSDVKTTIKGPLANAAKPVDVYANINFALFRVIIPFMQDKTACTSREATPSGFEAWLSDQYIAYMQQKIFTPIGLNSVTCKPSLNTAQGFSEIIGDNVGSASLTLGDWTQSCGGGGFYMSAMEMARFMAYLQHSNVLLDATQRNLMDSKLLGWDNEDSRMTVAGPSYGKDGALWTDSNNNNVQDNGDAGLQTFVVKFPNRVELTLVINSIPGGFRGIANFVTSAYNNAWEKQ